MEFRLCPVNDKLVRATQECLDQNQLEIVNYGMSYPVREGEREINIRFSTITFVLFNTLTWFYFKTQTARGCDLFTVCAAMEICWR